MTTNAELLEQAQRIDASLGVLSTDVRKLTAYGQQNRRYIGWLAASLIFDVILSLALGIVALNAKNASDGARAANRVAQVAETNLCHATQASWDTRAALADILTKPTVLSPEAARLFPTSQTESLRLQIDQANRTKLAQRAALQQSNGPRPVC